jgi:hypothetical protein
MDDVPMSATWILGGATIAAPVVTLVGLAPRLAGAYPTWLTIAIVLILLGLVGGCTAIVLQLASAGRTNPKPSRGGITSVAIGMACVVLGTAVIAVSYIVTLSTDDVPRLTLSVTGIDRDMATVKVKFEADGLNPGQSVVVNHIAVQRNTTIRVGVDQVTPGHRFYRATIGSDSTGKVSSDIETAIRREDYQIVVAEVWPVPLEVDKTAPNNQEASTALCGNVGKNDKRDPRSCAYTLIPDVDGPGA